VNGAETIQVTGPAQKKIRYIVGEDREGRIFLSDERRVFVYRHGWPEGGRQAPAAQLLR